ncbi:KAP family P-loop NTPase fold protein [Planktosalinus lacus]|uniref:KAP NTPase domain-containing protein n=1 Tax=Planktosalinus lacus TaxID=1526573 RepID=A0A8J2VE49_9FLAO|nr:P-loop NTPase fold protein [Planktosalinus lacus]GGD99569.1 hypothetical protein GCM10011312_23780 [Planktosalinus lacus]
MERILKGIQSTFTAKRILLALVVTLLFFIKVDWVVVFINKFLMIPKEFSNYFLDTILIIVTGSFLFWFTYLFFRKNYKASYNQVASAIVVILLISFFFYNSDKYDWDYHTIFNTSLEYIWLIIIPLIIFIFFHFINFFFPFKKYKQEILRENQLVQDNPIKLKEMDLLGYESVVDKLYNILLSQETKKSMTIGLVGPWGNGKSSVIQMLLDRLEPKMKYSKKFNRIFKKDIEDLYLIVHFLPYLNHQEGDLISEFFRELSSKLRPFNGKLSNLVLEYSKRLVDFHKNGINLNFFDKHVSSFEKTSAKEMYDDINERLLETDKKIIVFLDDLDRLNSKEILQVLKLIRNSADFTNVIFLVAMDKAYVVKLLTKKQEILNARFIDKFFQLEVYLPEIKKTKLKEIFTNLLVEKKDGFNKNYERDLSEAVGSSKNLFNDYIKNIRDVKRTVNQIIYEYKRVEGAVDLTDFMNYTYLKLKFPSIITFLKNNRSRILKSDREGKKYTLKKLNANNGNRDYSLFEMISNKGYNYKKLSKYEIYNDFFDTEEPKLDPLIEEIEDRLLILKTLSYLFGDDNNTENVNSIMNIRNFMMLMEQRIFDDYLDEFEADNLFKVEEDEIENVLDRLKNEKKIEQVLERLSYSIVGSAEHLERTLKILGLLNQKHTSYNLYEHSIGEIISRLIDQANELVDKNKGLKEEYRNAILNGLFDTPLILNETKIGIISDLWTNRGLNDKWIFTKKEINNYLLKNYKDYLIENDGVNWGCNEDKFIRIYIDISQIEDVTAKVNIEMIAFWTRNSIKMLCAKSLNFSSFSLKAFAVSDLMVKIFGSFMDFKLFVENHQDKNEPEIIEYIKFLNIAMYTNFNNYIIFEFKVFKLMIERIKSQEINRQSYDRDQFENTQQLLFVYKEPELNDKRFSIIRTLRESGFTNVKDFSRDGWFSLFITAQNLPDQELKVANTINFIAQTDSGKDLIDIDEASLFSNEPFMKFNNYQIFLYSKQPN